ncbi:MAG: nickel insertion protein, partial [Pseudonocardiaceae bacterium]
MTELKAAYLDCTAGVAGDMLLGALLDAGADLAAVRTAVASLGVPGLHVEIQQTRRCGLRCARAVVVTPAADQPTRGLSEVLTAIEQARLGGAAAQLAAETFRLLAAAEAAVHGIPAELVHFH